jgi:hypothetical protein
MNREQIPSTTPRRCGAWLATATTCLALALTGCGGGGSSNADYGGTTPPVVTTPPPAVTATLQASGGTVESPLVNGGSVAVAVPARAASAPALSITITPLAVNAAASGAAAQWTQFTITPGIQTVGAPLTLRVRPPAATVDQVPVLQVQTADGPVHLLTSLQADGTLLATLKPELFAPASRNVAKPGEPNPQKDNTVRLQTAVIELPTTISGVLLSTACHLPQGFVDDFDRVINNAGSVQAIRTALTAILQVRDNCTPARGVLPTDVAGVTALLRTLVTNMPGFYTNSLATWRAVDYSNFNSANYNTFIRGVRRQMGLCAAVQELGSALACPAEADFADQYDELVQGFTDAAAGREGVYGLHNDHELLLGLKNDVNFLGFDSAIPALNRAISKSADRLIERSYQLCNTGELSAWGDYIAANSPTSFTGAQLLDAAALCGTRLSIEGTSTVGGVRQPFGPLLVEPGGVRGAGRVQLQEVTVDSVGTSQITIKLLSSLPSRCSRVIGTPHGSESFFMRVNNVEIGRFELQPNGTYQDLYINETSTIFETLRRTPTSPDPLVIDIVRGATQVNGCDDGSGGTYSFNLPERKIYTFRLVQSSSVAGIYIGSMEFRYQEQRSSDFEDRSDNSSFLDLAVGSIRTSISATMVVTARITPGRPIEFLAFVPFSVSGNKITSVQGATIGRSCPTSRQSTVNETIVAGPSEVFVSSSSLPVSGDFEFTGSATVAGTSVVLSQFTLTGEFTVPGQGNICTTISDNLQERNVLSQVALVSGTGTLRSGTFTGSARGVEDFSGTVVTGTERLTLLGSGEMSVTWNLVRQ